MSAATPPLDRNEPSPTLLMVFVRYAFWPLAVVGSFGVMAWAFATDQRDTARGLLALGALTSVIFIEQLLPRRKDQGIRNDRDLPTDLALFVSNGFMEALTNLAFFAPMLWLGPLLVNFLGTGIWPTHWAWPVQAGLAFLLLDFFEYWVHRASHRVPWLWSIHMHHHASERLHVFKGPRNHPFAGLVRTLGAYLPLILLGAPVEMLFGYQVFLQSVGSIGHANLDMRFAPWIHHWLVTPPVHWIHHARAHELHDRNFAAFTPIWDRLFGTFEAPAPGRGELDYGLDPGQAPKRFWRIVGWPLGLGRSG